MLKRVILTGAALVSFSALTLAQSMSASSYPSQQQCSISPMTLAQIQGTLASVIQSGNGGLFRPNNMWAAIVDRKGVLCSVINTIGDNAGQDPWPGSRSIAIAKASTANDFSNNKLALSTANLYGVSLPGGSLWGLNVTNPFNPQFQPQGTGVGFVPGGIVTFGGGVALYWNGQVIGGLGVSGDTSCADHAIAYKMRAMAGLQPVFGTGSGQINGVGPNGTDNILYAPANSTALTIANTFQQPHCLPTDITP